MEKRLRRNYSAPTHPRSRSPSTRTACGGGVIVSENTWSRKSSCVPADKRQNGLWAEIDRLETCAPWR